jgi:hypothetical protein
MTTVIQTPKIRTICIGLSSILEGLVIVLTLGIVTPSWAFATVVWFLKQEDKH